MVLLYFKTLLLNFKTRDHVFFSFVTLFTVCNIIFPLNPAMVCVTKNVKYVSSLLVNVSVGAWLRMFDSCTLYSYVFLANPSILVLNFSLFLLWRMYTLFKKLIS